VSVLNEGVLAGAATGRAGTGASAAGPGSGQGSSPGMSPGSSQNPGEPVSALWVELERVLARLKGNAQETPALAGDGLDLGAFETGAVESPAAQTRSAGGEPWNPVRQLKELFGLSGFELDTVLLCAGFALDRRFREVLDSGSGPGGGAMTFGLAASVLAEPHWSAFSDLRPLRYWRLVEVGAGSLLQAPVEIDERVLQFLLGVAAVDSRLFFLVSEEGDALEGANEAVLRGVAHWRGASQRAPLLLVGTSAGQRTALFRSLCREAGVRGLALDAADLPADPSDRERLARALTREAALWPAALLVKTGRLENVSLLQAWLERVNAPVAVEVELGSTAERVVGLRLEVPTLSHAERKALWARELGQTGAGMDGTASSVLDAIVDAFGLDPAEIRATAGAVQEEVALGLATEGPAVAAWRLARAAARKSLDDLAARAEVTARWEDLILPEEQMQVLKQIAANARGSFRVLQEWGFAGRYARGLGLSVMFSGASGTGKTMAAGILARELGRDLYQIDLATVASKYIGETEKNLRRIFDAAERSGAVLLFDEADALFGKRSQVKDSHDRYANLEISYLLQRMEAYRGIAILTTNMQNSLDPAFQRRLRFVVQFPFPDTGSRERIWRGVFPAGAPVEEGLDCAKLAQLNVTGGVIRNIALLAAFLAADQGTAIGMRHVREAARTEYAKLEKPLVGAEVRGWE
jgi:hypothetical protein